MMSVFPSDPVVSSIGQMRLILTKESFRNSVLIWTVRLSKVPNPEDYFRVTMVTPVSPSP